MPSRSCFNSLARFFVLLLIPCSSLIGNEWLGNDWEASFRVAAYRPFSDRVAKIYSEHIPFYQFEVDYHYCGSWDIWANVGYLTDKGRSEGCHNKTRLNLIPIGLGVNYNVCTESCFKPYLGAGVTYSFLNIHDDSEFVHKHVNKSVFGGVFKSGIRYEICSCYFVEIFADYYYTKFKFSHGKQCVERHDADLSGVMAGAGLGYKF